MGDKFQLQCYHMGCHRYISLVMDNPSMGYASHKKLGRIDLRNQVWFCYQHRALHRKNVVPLPRTF